MVDKVDEVDAFSPIYPFITFRIPRCKFGFVGEFVIVGRGLAPAVIALKSLISLIFGDFGGSKPPPYGDIKRTDKPQFTRRFRPRNILLS